MSDYKTQWMRSYRQSKKHKTESENTNREPKKYRAGTAQDFTPRDWGNRKKWEGLTSVKYKVFFENGTTLTVPAPDEDAARAIFRDAVIEKVEKVEERKKRR